MCLGTLAVQTVKCIELLIALYLSCTLYKYNKLTCQVIEVTQLFMQFLCWAPSTLL